jgi:hypothetical protein
MWRRERASDREASGALYNLGLCAIYERDFVRAAQLWAVWEDLITDDSVHYWTWSPREIAFRDESLDLLTEALGPDDLSHQMELGRQVPLEQAIDIALGRSDPHL